MLIVLTVTEGPCRGQVFRFTEHGTLLIGRTPGFHLCLEQDPYLSRAHCLIEVNPPLCRLTDMASRSGTLVNGRRIQSVDLHHGDEIKAGSTVLQVSIPTVAPDPTLALPPMGPPGEGSTLTYATDESHSLRIAGFQLESVLGEGGMGVVYRATRLEDGRAVALKTIRPAVQGDERATARFLREAEILRQLDHPNIVRCLSMGATEGLLYFVMELVNGVDARKLVAQSGPLDLPRALRLMHQLLDALAFAHDRGYVHRDIKPANILVENSGPEEQARVADFGLARTYQDSPLSGLTLSGSMGGTPQFMAPEQVTDFRNVRPAADQYAAAATLYYLLTAHAIYPGETMDRILSQLLTAEPTPPATYRPDLPPGLWPVLKRALAREPGRRFADVRALAGALRGLR